MSTKRNLQQTALTFAVAFLFASGLAFAKLPKWAKSAGNAGEISLASSAKLANGPELKAGTYKVEVLSNSNSPDVVFYKNGKVVARTAAQLVDADKKNEASYVVATKQSDGSDVIAEIGFRGRQQKIILQQNAEPTESGR